MNRIIWWHIPNPGVPLPAFYMEKDYVPKNVRIYAETAPTIRDLEVEIRNNGTSIFAERDSSYRIGSPIYSEISYNTLATSTFRVDEIITGGTSGAHGRVISDNTLGNMTLDLIGDTVFTVGETITGGTSLATAVVLNFILGEIQATTMKRGVVKATAALPKGMNLEEYAEDFTATTIEAGSVLTCHVIEMSNANNVTIQLELETLDEDEEVYD